MTDLRPSLHAGALFGSRQGQRIKREETVFHLWTFRDGMPWRCEVFADEGPALKAAGLSEQDAHADS